MTKTNTKHGRTRRERRGGVAAVEAAMVLPVFVLFFVGAVDAGQFSNCYQRVSEASREGARSAARYGSSHASEVETAVLTYLEDAFPQVPEATLAGAVDVTIRDANGAVVSGSSLGFIAEGEQLEVEVALQFDTVRWFSGLGILGGQTMRATTVMRRE